MNPKPMATLLANSSLRMRNNAGWYVAAAWLLLIPIAFLAFIAGMGRAIEAVYDNPLYEWANYDRTLVHLLAIAFWGGLLTAVASSSALGSGARTIASAVVVVFWLGLIAGGTLWLASVGRGPQQFSRYAGQRQFLVPWQYDPRGSESPSRSGFHVSLCFYSFLGTYDKACRYSSKVTILPAESGIDSWEERIWQWKYRLNQMSRAGERQGFQIYIETGFQVPTVVHHGRTYYRRIDSEGKSNCLVICEGSTCERQALIGQLVIDYFLPPEATFVEWNRSEQKLALPESEFAEWDEMDQKLAALVNTWTAP